MDTRPRVFQAGSIFNSETYEQILCSVYDQQKIYTKEEKDNSDNAQTFNDILNQTTTTNEIERLSQLIIRALPTSHNEVAHILLDLLDLVNNTPTTSTLINVNDMNIDQISSNLIMTSSHLYTPIHQTGVVLDHDRPFADYGHLGMYILMKIN